MRPVRAAVFASALLSAGCSFFAPTISIENASPEAVYAALNSNVLIDDEPSAATREVLHAYGLSTVFEDDPLQALRALHDVVVRDPSRVGLFALAELSFYVGNELEDHDCHLAAAVYAWLYLFGSDAAVPPSPYDRRFRWACDLYNTAIDRAFTSADGETMQIVSQERTLPVGSIRITVDRSAFPWSEVEYSTFLPGDRFLIQGLSVRIRDSGLGVPLIALPAVQGLNKTPASALLRVSGSLADLAAGLTGTLELYSSLDASTIAVDEARVPIESDVSVALAYGLHESPLWKFSLTGLFEGQQAVHQNRLIMIRPYQRGRIPVVFVHGTASNPAYWAEMFNSLLGDSELRKRMQFWFFQYSSGNPIIYSAGTLRDQLAAKLKSCDPDGRDPALRQMIVIGHSQGCLVSRLLVADGSLAWFEESVGRPLASFGFDEEQLELLRWAFEFDPLPQVSRMVFLCGPHRGSFAASSWYSRWIAKFIAIPGEVQGLGARIAGNATKLPASLAGRLPTALDNMDPDSPLLRNLMGQPLAPGVKFHSIIAIQDADPADPAALAESDDGVVAYSSAHLEGVESELLVHAAHSCQDDPTVIQEVRRILTEHLRDSGIAP